jgi:hypothetical protein
MKIKGIHSQMLACCVVALGTMLGVLALWSAPVRAVACPNEQVRSESDVNPTTSEPGDLALPECRAYELVTPPFKEGFHFGFGRPYVGTDGSHVIDSSFGNVAGSEDNVNLSGAAYLLSRTASGWVTTPLEPPASQFPNGAFLDATPQSLETTLWQLYPASRSAYAPSFYLRQPDGSFIEIGPGLPPSVTIGPPDKTKSGTAENGAVHYAGASADLSHMLFFIVAEEPGVFWPGDDTVPDASEHPSLYEYVGTADSRPLLVGVDNDGDQIGVLGTQLGGTDEKYNAISQGGSTVFFTVERSGGAYQLFARIDGGQPDAVTVNVAGASGCSASASCDVTSAVHYAGASSDGSRVFFTTGQALLGSDTSNNLYECELPGDAGVPPSPTSGGVVNPCPTTALKEISATSAAGGAQVQGVARISEDGSHVYYVAKGELASNENNNGEKPAEGADNLYVWEPSSAGRRGHTAFIAMLCSGAQASGSVPDSQCASSLSASTADTGLWAEDDGGTEGTRQIQVTPDGEYAVFGAVAHLTPGDTSTVEQLFEYDAQTGGLIRLSEGYEDNNGNTTVYPAFLPNLEYSEVSNAGSDNLALSADGSRVFFTSDDALTPGASDQTFNLYEWRDGDLSLLSGDFNASGAPAYVTEEEHVLGTTPSGGDVFFQTSEPLVSQDTDTEEDVYDARVEGGFPASAPPPSCQGEGCQGQLGAALSPSLPGSVSLSGAGNLAPAVKPSTVSKAKAKALTRAQKLARALQACKRKPKKDRAACQALARKRYGAKAEKTKKKSKATNGNRRGK